MIPAVKVLSSSLFVALYGSFRFHPWLTSDSMGEDAYSLFFHRAEMMGWSRSATPIGGPKLWGMNDASFDPASGEAPEPPRIGRLQVGVEEESLTGAPLPFHPLLACAADSVSRAGVLSLAGVRLLVPLQAMGAPAPLSTVHNWFTLCDPASRVDLRVTVDSGEDPILPRVASELGERVAVLANDPFSVAPLPDLAAHVRLQPEVTDGYWLGDARHPVTFDVVAPEWTPDSIAWVAILFTEACRQLKIATSVLLSVARR